MSSSAVGPAPTRTAAPPRAPWRGLPDLARPIAVAAAIAVWTLLVNLPTFARQDADDAFFLEAARLWTEGLPPYVAAYDVKGPAGFAFQDPTFGCPIMRVSDEKTAAGMAVVTPAVAFANSWNADSTLFYVLANGAANIPFRFDPQTMTASRIPGLPFLPEFGNESTFSRHDPNICFGKDRRRNVIVQYDFSSNTATDVVDVARLTGTEPGYMSTLTISADDVLALVFGGPTQDASPYLLVYDLKTRKHRLWNTKDGTLDGKPLPNAPKFTQHTGLIDLSGRYVMTLGPGVTGPIVWDTKTDDIYPVTAERSGHHVLGYAAMVNDVHKWVYRGLDPAAIDNPRDLMQHPAGEVYFDYDSHVSWNNARPGRPVPVVLSTYHMLERGDPKCVWGDEVLAVATDGSRQVWRFAHHRSTGSALCGSARSRWKPTHSEAPPPADPPVAAILAGSRFQSLALKRRNWMARAQSTSGAGAMASLEKR